MRFAKVYRMKPRMLVLPMLFVATLVCACASMQARDVTALLPAAARQAGLVDVRGFVPDAQLDIRYATTHNFVGARIDGYNAPRCWLHRPAAEALAKVAMDVRGQGLRLHIYDCYRPARAVAHFMRWANDLDDQRTKTEFYPRLEKSTLVPGYIAERSGHSRGATIDLTLSRCDANDVCVTLDMGTTYDLFDARANTDNADVTATQRANRDLLRDAMQGRGFANYPMEWWHFTFKPEPTPDTFFDIPLE
ncbi:D-Ala-D-Ala dipeptidase vanX. Metallo peptidase. MEROPS family M15D [Solilutibacter tolerans]|uniref:D-alanyl-D-alanine dipeptidase n=2 Tax=Solilutibacter tolerans TaxID=1604334 RepID=A0A1N6YBR4_9GAMM|nr:D-Ala-D-Ala dipeptidase vanX. Metallo peptidase. MEROPS family M15D [Lysobacter tolerans]